MCKGDVARDVEAQLAGDKRKIPTTRSPSDFRDVIFQWLGAERLGCQGTWVRSHPKQ